MAATTADCSELGPKAESMSAMMKTQVTAARRTIGWEHPARRIAAVLAECVEDRT